jgi:hypothetical protein
MSSSVSLQHQWGVEEANAHQSWISVQHLSCARVTWVAQVSRSPLSSLQGVRGVSREHQTVYSRGSIVGSSVSTSTGSMVGISHQMWCQHSVVSNLRHHLRSWISNLSSRVVRWCNWMRVSRWVDFLRKLEDCKPQIQSKSMVITLTSQTTGIPRIWLPIERKIQVSSRIAA